MYDTEIKSCGIIHLRRSPGLQVRSILTWHWRKGKYPNHARLLSMYFFVHFVSLNPVAFDFDWTGLKTRKSGQLPKGPQGPKRTQAVCAPIYLLLFIYNISSLHY